MRGDQKKYEDLKNEVRSILLTYKNNVVLQEFLKAYKCLTGQVLPFRQFGYLSDISFFKSMPDVVDIYLNSEGKILLRCIPDKASQYFQKLKSKSSFKQKQHITRQPNCVASKNISEPKEITFLPGRLRAEIMTLMNSHNHGISLPALVISYIQKFKKLLPLHNGLKTLENIICLIPELRLEKNNNNEITIHYHEKYLKKKGLSRKTKSPSGLKYGTSLPHIHKSGIPDDVSEDFQINKELSNEKHVCVYSDWGYANIHNAFPCSNGDVLFESNNLATDRKLSSCTYFPDDLIKMSQEESFKKLMEEEDNHFNSIIQLHFNDDFSFKRYVKILEICQDKKIHLINLKNELFMSVFELTGLLWSHRKPTFLLHRLQDIEINIPFLHIKEEDNPELFRQCLWYKIPDLYKEDSLIHTVFSQYSEKSSLILCPIKEAYNVLNIFGHPSTYLRAIIRHEIKTFDPLHIFWNEFCYDESPSFNALDHFLEGINKLCLYDLKTKKEVLKAKIWRLLHAGKKPFTQNIRQVENTISIINRRMQAIEAICTQYSPSNM